jgi:hypothetical protein
VHYSVSTVQVALNKLQEFRAENTFPYFLFLQKRPELVVGVMEQVVKHYRFSYDDTWPAAFLVDPINFIHTDGGWMLPYGVLVEGSEISDLGNLLEDAKAAIVRLAGGGAAGKSAVMKEFGELRMGGVPAVFSDLCETLAERNEQEDGSVQLRPAEYRRKFWQGHMSRKFPLMSAVAARLLSAHVTSCATERNWSLFGNIFSKTKNRLALERAKKLAFIRGNSKGSTGADEEVMLSVIDVLDE